MTPEDKCSLRLDCPEGASHAHPMAEALTLPTPCAGAGSPVLVQGRQLSQLVRCKDLPDFETKIGPLLLELCFHIRYFTDSGSHSFQIV